MRVLHVNKFGWPKGGSELYMLRTCERLATMPDMDVGVWAERPEVDGRIRAYDAVIPDFHNAVGGREKLGAAARVLWSTRAKRELGAVLDDFEPDVVHLHLYAHQFSSSIVQLLRERRVATVATAHDYKLICPSYHAVRSGDDCFRCATRLSPTLLTDSCLHGKRSWSAIAFAEAVVVRRLRLLPDVVIAPSRFMLERLEESWLREETSLALLRNPAQSSGLQWEGGGDYLLYVGRLIPEKGVGPLLDVARSLSLPLVIAGDGPDRARLEALAPASVSFVGHVDASRLAELRQRSLAQVVPSALPENAPLAALEAAVDGVPLIATARGGVGELFELGARGVALRGDSLGDWREAVDAVRTVEAGDAGLRELREAVGWEAHLAGLAGIYGEAAALRGVRRGGHFSNTRSAAELISAGAMEQR